MAVQLNHTIVRSRGRMAGAPCLACIPGLPGSHVFGHFGVVETANGVSLDYANRSWATSDPDAFFVDETDFDSIFQRVQDANISYYADPGHRWEGEINARGGGRTLLHGSRC